MKQIRKIWAGYTIVELLIVVSVSSAIAVSAIVLVQGQQAKNEYTQATGDFQAKLTDIANDVAAGYFIRDNNFVVCKAGDSGGITFGPQTIGNSASSDCVFAGKAVELKPGSGSKDFNVFTLASRKYVRNGGRVLQVSEIDQLSTNDIKPAKTTNDTTDLVEVFNLLYGLEVMSVKHDGNNVSGLVFLSGFSRADSVNATKQVGAPITDLYWVSGGGIFTNKLTNPSQYREVTDEIAICTRLGGSGGRQAIFFLGKDDQRLSVQTLLDPDSSEDDVC